MNYKKTLAAAIAVSMAISSSAFAAASTGAIPESVEKTEEQQVPVYTFDEVYEMAKKNSSTLKLLEENSDLLSAQGRALEQSLGGLTTSGSPMGFTYTPEYESIMQLTSLAQTRESDRYNKEAALLSLEGGIINTMNTIVIGERDLETSEITIANKEADLALVNLKKSLGTATETQVTAAQAELDQAKADAESAKKSVENAYSSLATVMGIKDTNFKISYSPEEDYEPYQLIGTLDGFLMQKNAENPSLKAMQSSIDYLERNKAFTLANSTSPYATDEMNYKISQANSNLKDLRDSLMDAGRAVYSQIITLEESIEAAESSLKAANDALKVAELNLETGNGIQLDVDKAKENVIKLEDSIYKMKVNHGYLVYSFENPGASMGGGSASSGN